MVQEVIFSHVQPTADAENGPIHDVKLESAGIHAPKAKMLYSDSDSGTETKLALRASAQAMDLAPTGLLHVCFGAGAELEFQFLSHFGTISLHRFRMSASHGTPVGGWGPLTLVFSHGPRSATRSEPLAFRFNGPGAVEDGVDIGIRAIVQTVAGLEHADERDLLVYQMEGGGKP